jgi:hypothetical protein
METEDKIKEYCENHGISYESLIDILNEPKVVPMIRGIGFEYTVLPILKKQLDSKLFSVDKPIINAQLGKPDIDIRIKHNQSGKKYSCECKLAKNNSFKTKSRNFNKPHVSIKVMRSRTLGEEMIKNIAKKENISPLYLSQHKDSYLYKHFQFVITNLRNAFYKTIGDKFVFSPTEEELDFLYKFTNENTIEDVDDFLKWNNFFIESKFLTPKYSRKDCRKRECERGNECIFIPNYPIFDLSSSSPWRTLNEIGSYIDSSC